MNLEAVAAGLAFLLSAPLGVLIGWQVWRNWRSGEIPERSGSRIRRRRTPRSFAFWFTLEAFGFFGLVAVSLYSLYRFVAALF
ncbi:hypothetical protein EMQ25_01650 [Arsenicitalea aurantiaca]|uniref:Uncharacterized protein n=1 Tax=Arsenicitalea aurantiaca TaxID=1783274 RepID=A0A433XKV4_9HYPH|nr:hypothetical protein [Arsenicitalea aurantiaca]RUT34693.1 hypothetical protein EMQ25_01650 [Arsenicitalea aurantiaca]